MVKSTRRPKDGFFLRAESFFPPVILDEPEAALSPTRQLAVLLRIHQLVEDNSQFIIATHSPILMAYPRAKLYLLDRAERDSP